MFRKPCVVGNWKMHGTQLKSFELIQAILNESVVRSLDLQLIDTVVCPPYVYLHQVEQTLTKGQVPPKVQLGAQDVFWEKDGAYTGEISTNMLVDLKCRFVIVGHSERRRLLGESNELVARKFRAAYDAGLIPILCVGETLTERESGQTMEVIQRQIDRVLEGVPVSVFEKALIAYEPVWAIGTGVAATPEQAEEVHTFIRDLIGVMNPNTAKALRILYGGSVKGELAQALFAKPNIDGALIGGASLISEEFLTICKAAISRTLWKTSS